MVIDPDDRLSYRELDQSTRALAARLIAAGITKGTRVGLVMPNGTRWVQIALAVTRIGAILVPLSTLLRPPELVAQLQTASVQYLIAVEEFRGHRYLQELAQKVRGAPSLLPALRQVLSANHLPDDPGPLPLVDALAATVRPADSLAIVFTSGSRGTPKGVIHSHGNALAAVAAGLSARCITADTRLYLPMPFFWVGGLSAGILTALVAGATLVTEPWPEPAETLRLLARERVTLFRGWPNQAEIIARQAITAGADLSALRPGSLEALLPPQVRAPAGARANLFGMTESFGPYCGYPADTDMPAESWGSCGKPFPGMDVRIVDVDAGAVVATGTPGMIQIRGRHVMRGLCGRSREEVFTADGFYSTGDLGHLNASGFLFYQGRSDDMFKVNGATVYPAEVEQALRGVSGVRDVWATNIPGPEGDQVGAAVACDTATVTVAALRTAAKKRLSSFKVPTVWRLLDDDSAIPRGSTGKVDVPRLRALLAEASPPPTNGDRR